MMVTFNRGAFENPNQLHGVGNTHLHKHTNDLDSKDKKKTTKTKQNCGNTSERKPQKQSVFLRTTFGMII